METNEIKTLKNHIIDLVLDDFKDCPSIIAKPRKYWYDRMEFIIYNNPTFHNHSSSNPFTLVTIGKKNKNLLWQSMVKVGKGEYQIVSSRINDYFQDWLLNKIFEK